ncbi:MAG: DinB family protein [Cyclobacteriaceae bacterium]|nr:DinB family protein [Cyclobacteriaceae bacterium]
MDQTPWFSRKFRFDFDQNIMPSLISRLEGAPLRLRENLKHIPEKQLRVKHDSKWSVLEHIGHLCDLEPLWQQRLQDILEGKEYLRNADLNNTKTDEANHNKKSPSELLEQFTSLRNETIDKLKKLNEEEIFKSSLHPRLKIPMNTLALFTFVADHDDHHLAAMS